MSSEVRAAKVSWGFLFKIIMIMAKVILTNGVINVEESYDQIIERIILLASNWIELTEDNNDIKYTHKAMGIEGDYRVIININHIQCIKP